MKQFSDFTFLPAVKSSLERLGFTQPTDIQSKTIPLLLDNFKQDVHAQAQTGTGKTLAFGIPLLHAIDTSKKSVQALIMAPTRELACQIYESLKGVSHGSDIRIEALYGGMPMDRQIKELKKGVHVIIGTPGRINDHLKRKTLNLDALSILVLDEADIMLDMGFRQEIDVTLKYAPKNRNIWLFSATVMSGVKKLITSHMKNVISLSSGQTNASNKQVKQYFCVVSQRQRIEATARFIAEASDFYGIIFCRTRTLTADVAKALSRKGLPVYCLHGDMRQSARNHIINGFKKKEFNILVATDVAARGIDVSDLTHVINYNIPDDNESYVHRIGRTGRAGKEGIAILFVAPSEMYRMSRLEKVTKSKLEEIKVPSFDSILKAQMGEIARFISGSAQHVDKSSAIDKNLRELFAECDVQDLENAFVTLIKDRFFSGMNEKDDFSAKRERSLRNKRLSKRDGDSGGYKRRRRPRDRRNMRPRRTR